MTDQSQADDMTKGQPQDPLMFSRLSLTKLDDKFDETVCDLFACAMGGGTDADALRLFRELDDLVENADSEHIAAEALATRSEEVVSKYRSMYGYWSCATDFVSGHVGQEWSSICLNASTQASFCALLEECAKENKFKSSRAERVSREALGGLLSRTRLKRE